MRDNRFECGCERGGDCTKTTMCQLQAAIEDEQMRIEELEAAMYESYEPGCDCACCWIVRAELQEKERG